MTYLIPVLLSALAVAILAVGLPFSARFLRRGRYIGGIIAVAVSLISLWLLQAIIAAFDVQSDTRWVLQIGAFVFSLCVFASGVGAVSKANNTPRDDYYDNLLS